MAPTDEVPEADRLEQETPAQVERAPRHVPPDAPEADVLEQELPLVDEGEVRGIDAERTEPVADDEWAATSSE